MAQLSSELAASTALQNFDEQEMLTYEDVQALVEEYDTQLFSSAVDVFVMFEQKIDELVPKDEVIEYFEEYADYGSMMEEYFDEYGGESTGEYVFSVFEKLANDDMVIHIDDLRDWVHEEGLTEAGAWAVWHNGLLNADRRKIVGADPDLFDGYFASHTIFEAVYY